MNDFIPLGSLTLRTHGCAVSGGGCLTSTISRSTCEGRLTWLAALASPEISVLAYLGYPSALRRGHALCVNSGDKEENVNHK
jgi:hypothetical protein